MKIMVGIDLHSNNALCGLMDESGRRLIHKKLPCDLPTILQVLQPYKERIATIAVESTYNWYWLVDVSGRSKPATKGRIKTSQFEGKIIGRRPPESGTLTDESCCFGKRA